MLWGILVGVGCIVAIFLVSLIIEIHNSPPRESRL